MYFPTTQWSLLAKATLDGQTEGRAALGELCRRYWRPLNQFIRSRGYSEAESEDLTQEFLLHLLEHSTLLKPDPLRGKFRSFLLGSLVKFLSHERERRFAQKRGGQQPHVSVEMLEGELSSPQLAGDEVAEFDRIWALTILRTALANLEGTYLEAGKGELFAILRTFLPGSNAPPSYEAAAGRAGSSVVAFTSEIHRLRQKFRELIYAEVTGTVSAPHEVEEEIAYLHRVLRDRGTDLRSGGES
jgi:DNA-directed RNA polymerase specialized sigma24 family protein